MEKCYVALGGNLGDPARSIKLAFELLSSHPRIQEAVLSPLYLTTPISEIDQPDFVNGVCSFLTSLEPLPLLYFLQFIERRLGKVVVQHHGPRLIDLDLIFYGKLSFRSKELTLPHPRWEERSFVLRPLADLTDDFNVHQKLQNVEDVCLSQL